jgi:hypothetical protein
MTWKGIPRNARILAEDVEHFFSEFSSASQLTDEEVVERGVFLVRHMPPKEYLKLKVKGKFVQLAKRLNSVIFIFAINELPCI